MEHSKWISASQIDAFTSTFQDFCTQKANRVLVTNALFYTWLKSRLEYQEFNKQLSKEDSQVYWKTKVFEKHKFFTNEHFNSWLWLDKIIFPANMTPENAPEGTHWITIVVLPRVQKILLADSLSNDFTAQHKVFLRPLLFLLEIYSSTVKNATCLSTVNSAQHQSRWMVEMIKFVPVQNDSYNCGVYMLTVISSLIHVSSEEIIRAIRIQNIGILRKIIEARITEQEDVVLANQALPPYFNTKRIFVLFEKLFASKLVGLESSCIYHM